MKYLFSLLIALITFGNLSAQKWYSNLEEAQEVAQKTDKHILLMFTGSDWCGYCIRLEKRVLKKEGFIAKASEKFVFVKLDFPRRKPISLRQMNYNKAMLHRYNPQGAFPKLIVFDNKLNEKGIAGFEKMKPLVYANHLIDYTK